MTLFLSPGARSLQWGYKREREMGCPIGPVIRVEIDRSYAMNEVSNPKLELEEVDLGEPAYVWRERIPFYRRRGWLYK